MKNKKRAISILLTLILVFAMAIPVAAAGGGTITIDNAVEGHTYSVYKILDLESYNAEKNTYSYKAAEKWDDFINGSAVNGVYVNVDSQGYVTWVEGASAENFAKAAKAYADVKDNGITAEASKGADSTTVTFNNLGLGYYLVDTTLGALCSLDTTNPSTTIKEKNAAPSITKEVKEDSKDPDYAWGSWNDAEIGQDVEFRAVITAYKGAYNYVMHDDMDHGLTFNADSVAIEGLTAGTDYTVVTEGLSDGCDFEVRFAQTYLDTITQATDIVVTYTAKVNATAVIGTPGNPNTATLSYGEKVTPESSTTTYTWNMEVLKYGNGNENNVLEGAEFILLNSTKDKAVKMEEGVITWVDMADGTKFVTNANGKIYIAGLDSDTYFLQETKAPEGYNKLSGTIEVKPAPKEENGTVTYTAFVAKVNNNSGTELPSTGGMGTTLFYLLGAIMVIGAGVVLVTRRRVA